MKIHAGMLFVVLVAGCGPEKRDLTHPTGDEIDAACSSTISGKVFAPNGMMPLYSVTVYAPVSDPLPFIEGVQCGQCSTGLPGGSTANTSSDANGAFTLEVPPGVNVPVIVTTGKWRRKVTIPFVAACTDNPQPDGTFRLPKNRTEGDIPRIAVVAGGCDPLACILPKLGIDSSEFGDNAAGANRVVFYNGSGGDAPGNPKAATVLWGDLNEMKKFDVIINSCECDEHNEIKTSPDLLRQYADLGGRVFGSHFHYTWSKNLVPAWQSQATWTAGSFTTPDLVDTSFAKGEALAQWLVTVGASTTLGQITLGTKTYNASTVAPTTQRWLYSSGSPATSHYISFDTPVNVPAGQQCGKVVYAGMHVSSGSVGTTFPAACGASFSPDEKALAFLLFDLTSCVGTLF